MQAYLLSQAHMLAVTLALLVISTAVNRIRRLSSDPVDYPRPAKEAAIAVIPFALMLSFTIPMYARSAPNAGAMPRTYTLSDAIVQLILNAAIFFPFGIAMAACGQGWRTVLLTRRNLLESAVVGIIASVAATAFFDKLSSSFWFSTSTLYALIAHLGVGFSEEAIFRGYLLTRFTAWLRAPRAEWLTAATFSLVHIPQRLSTQTQPVNLVIDMLVILAIGWVFARTMRRMGNVTGLAILHAVFNVLGG